MAKMKQSLMGSGFVETRPKKTRQGLGKTLEVQAATSRNKTRKRYRIKGDDKDNAISSTSKGTLCNE